MQKVNLFSFNNTMYQPDVAETVPLLMELLEDVTMGAMTAGIITKDVDSVFGKGSGIPLFIIPAKTRDSGNNASLSYSVAVSSTDGKITITQHSTNATSTANITNSFLIVGRVLPKTVTIE